MLDWETWMWLAVIVLSVICEAETAALVAIWFIPAALVSMILSFFNVALWIQVLVFFATAAVLIFVFKKFFNLKVKKDANAKTNLDMLIGQKCIVVEEISNIHARGAVKINGQIWSARSADGDSVIPEGAVVLIERVEGVKLICSEVK